MLLERKYQEFLVNNFQAGIQLSHLDITVAGWKILIRENLSPIIEKELQMTQISDFVWASDYQGGKRKVLSFFKINDAYATFKWGWNFDFIPRCSGNRFVLARTDKTIYTHIYELSPDFYNSNYGEQIKQEARDKVIMTRFGVDVKNIDEGILKKINRHQEVFFSLLPAIREYYNLTGTLEEILTRIDINLKNTYYHFINPELKIAKVFIEYHLGLQEKALYDFEEIAFHNDNIKSQCYKRLLSPK